MTSEYLDFESACESILSFNEGGAFLWVEDSSAATGNFEFFGYPRPYIPLETLWGILSKLLSFSVGPRDDFSFHIINNVFVFEGRESEWKIPDSLFESIKENSRREQHDSREYACNDARRLSKKLGRPVPNSVLIECYPQVHRRKYRLLKHFIDLTEKDLIEWRQEDPEKDLYFTTFFRGEKWGIRVTGGPYRPPMGLVSAIKNQRARFIAKITKEGE